MELHSRVTRFCFICNYVSRIIGALRPCAVHLQVCRDAVLCDVPERSADTLLAPASHQSPSSPAARSSVSSRLLRTQCGAA